MKSRLKSGRRRNPLTLLTTNEIEILKIEIEGINAVLGKREIFFMVTVRAKVRNYTEEEWAALNLKLNNPDWEVLCPRCGNNIEYEEIGNSISVSCLSENCIFGGLRGL